MSGHPCTEVLEQFFKLKNIFVFLFCIQFTSANDGYGDLLVNSTLIYDSCVSLCETSQVDERITHCQRGCRLFDTLFIQNSFFVKFDDAVAFIKCNNSCYEAYSSETSAMACCDGCNNFQNEYLVKRREVEQELEEAGRSLLLVFFKPYSKFKSSEKLTTPQVFKVEDFQVEEVTNPSLNSSLANTKMRTWRQSPPIVHQPTKFPRLRNFPTPSTSPTAPAANWNYWITPSSMIIFVLGIFVILGLTCLCCINGKRHISNATTTTQNSSPAETDPPPSYEQATTVVTLP